jgi:hypothetical protein
LVIVPRRYTQVRARKLAEAAAIVNELLLKASTLVSSALASETAQPKDVLDLLAQVGSVWRLMQCNTDFV